MIEDDRRPARRYSQWGPVVGIALVAVTSAAAMAMARWTGVAATGLTSGVGGASKELHAARALALAEGELERAKNVVNAAPYEGRTNTALAAALLCDPSVIPGTTVEVERIGGPGGPWYSLEARASSQGVTRLAQVFVRERTPVSAYAYFVIDHELGISGAPRGAIHSNKSIDFHFPWGFYRDRVTAAEGFDYEAGATPENTRLRGSWNPHVDRIDVLDGFTVDSLRDAADALRVTERLIAEVELQGEDLEVALYAPSCEMRVPRTEVRKVFSHYEDRLVYLHEPVYDEVTVYEDKPVYEEQEVAKNREVRHYDTVWSTEQSEKPVYEWRQVTRTVQEPVWGTRTVTVEVSEEVWVEDPPPDPASLEGPYALQGSGPELGHWETVTYTIEEEQACVSGYVRKEIATTEKVLVGHERIEVTRPEKVYTHSTWEEHRERVSVAIGTRTVAKTEKVFSHMERVPRTVRVPVYIGDEVTVHDTITVPEELLRTVVAPAQGLIYFEGEVRSLRGKLEGQLSLVSNSGVRITDSIVYVDGAGEQRMLGGLDPSAKFSFNPDYAGDAVLGILARGDIRYGIDAPAVIEINASLISIEGMVGFEGITVSDEGDTVGSRSVPGAAPEQYVKDSIRRLGGIVSRKRPVTTWLDASNRVLAGFRAGVSIMDRSLILGAGGSASPPSVLEENRPTWSLAASGSRLEVR